MNALIIIDISPFYLWDSNRSVNWGKKFCQDVIDRILQAEENGELVVFVSDQMGTPKDFKYEHETGNPLLDEGRTFTTLMNRNQCFTKQEEDAFSNPRLHKHLQEKQSQIITLCGLYTDWCVAATIKGAVERDYKVKIPPRLVISECGVRGGEQQMRFLKKLGAEIDGNI